VNAAKNLYPKIINIFERGDNAASPIRGEPSSDHAVPTVAMYRLRELSYKMSGHCITRRHIPENEWLMFLIVPCFRYVLRNSEKRVLAMSVCPSVYV